MAELNVASVQKRAKSIILDAGHRDIYSDHHHWLKFRPEVGLAHIAVPGNACGLDLDFQGESIYQRCGFTLLPHNIDSPEQQSTLFAIWLWWAQCVEEYI